jgi:hypothetical protein
MHDVGIDTSVNNLAEVRIGDLTLWFSYKTCVAVRSPGTGRIVSENYWGTTTGKHINSIDGNNKKTRLKSDAFESALSAVLKKYHLIPE